MAKTFRTTEGFGLLATSNYTTIETEELIYPWQSLVAEFGGCLGLFLGFSAMTIWDSVISVNIFQLLADVSQLQLQVFSGSLTKALQSLFVQIGDRASHKSFKTSVGEKLSHHHLESTSVEELHDEVLHAPIVDPLLDGLLDQGTCCPVHQVPSSFTIATSKKSPKSSKFTSKLSN